MRFLAISLLALAAFSAAAPAAAQTDAHDEEARALFVAGSVAYREGRYQEAYDRYLAAYEASGRSQLLYNLGMVAERLRQDELALEHYRAYLEAVPDASNRELAERRISFLEEQAERRAEEAADAEAAAAAAAASAVDPAASEGLTEEGADEPGRGALYTTYGLAGATAVSGILLIWSGVDAQNLNDAYLDAIAGGDRGEAEAALDDLHAAESRTNALIGVTCVLAAGTVSAALVHLLRSGEEDEPTVSAAPSIGPNGAGVSVRGVF